MSTGHCSLKLKGAPTGLRVPTPKFGPFCQYINALTNGYPKWWTLGKCIATASNMTSFWVSMLNFGRVIYMYICIYVNIYIYIYISICICVVTQATRGPLFSLCEVVFSLVNPTNWKDMKPRNFEVGNQASKSSNLNITHLRVISHKFDMF